MSEQKPFGTDDFAENPEPRCPCRRPTLVVKIYAQRPDDRTVGKLGAMIALAGPELGRVSAWPLGLLLDGRGGPVVGFVMPRVEDSRPIHVLHSPKTRRAFAFDPARDVRPGQWRELEERQKKGREAAWSTLRSRAAALRDCRDAILARRQEMQPTFDELHRRLAQLEADLKRAD